MNVDVVQVPSGKGRKCEVRVAPEGVSARGVGYLDRVTVVFGPMNWSGKPGPKSRLGQVLAMLGAVQENVRDGYWSEEAALKDIYRQRHDW